MIRSIYIIGVTDNPVKIGVADDVNKRLAGLQISSPDELVVHHVAHFPSYAAQKIETAVHRALAEHHRRGEWFNVSVETARLTVERVAPPIVAAERAWAASRAKLFDQRDDWQDFNEWAAEAVGYYKERKAGRDTVALQTMDRAIREVAGSDGLSVFKIQMIDGKELGSMFYRNLGGHRRALAALSQATNALSIWYAARREKLLLDEIQETP